MRRFNLSETQIRQKGVEKTNGALNIPNFQPLSSSMSIGKVKAEPVEQDFYVASPFDYNLERTRLAQSLQCKDVPDLVIPEIELPGVVNSLHYFQKPNIGNQRGDPRGLAYDPVYPTHTPLLKPADTFFAYLPSKLK
jgi:hypothetical protein